MTYRTLIFLLTTLLFSTSVSGQTKENVDTLVDDFTTSLRKKGIIKIGFTNHFCVGSLIDPKEARKKDYCNYEVIYYEVYVFWQDKGKTFLKKFDNCGPYNQIEIHDSIFFEFFDKYKDIIKNESVEPFQTVTIDGNNFTYQTSFAIHSCISEIMYCDNEDTIVKSINHYDLRKNFGDEKKGNVNWIRNNELKIVEWDRLTTAIIRQLEKDKKFKRVKK